MKNPFRYLTLAALVMVGVLLMAPTAGGPRGGQREAHPRGLRSRRLRLGAAVRVKRDALHEQWLPRHAAVHV